jgi:hypothetical protein
MSALANVNPTIVIQGMRFRLKETTEENLKAYNEALLDESRGGSMHEQYLALLPFLVEPADSDSSFDALKAESLNTRLVEAIAADFLPDPRRMFSGLAQFLSA